jgi:hypothetical protein
MKRRTLTTTFIAIGFFLTPIFIYLAVFGKELSSNHSRWAEFGSAIGGIYAPIVALLTLIVLFVQISLQRKMNKHEFDQAYLQQARADIEFYSIQIATIMEKQIFTDKTLQTVLHENFEPPIATDLNSFERRQFAARIHALVPSSYDLWDATYPILTGLAAGNERSFNMTLNSSKQKLIALLSFETCVALDNFHRARSEGRLNISYCFSPLLINA